ncbi:Type VI secretion system tip protein VgrG [Sulfidibacter corallicola]|uniref:Type VI secretion system tip protein VgrG n=1 Tax=Sulfidibacter corallicola TaxID=2818388 RepID=A0A8A4TSB7_SULCO|nr:type VI secretion system tip protein TssI/VgrG [Sulfidibacter corallicola]QTD51921.1 type VI secretion system tip protein VgrG [Sulfidibacter corallicola]
MKDLKWLGPVEPVTRLTPEGQPLFDILEIRFEQAVSQLDRYCFQLSSFEKDLQIEDFLHKSAQFSVLCGANMDVEKKYRGVITHFSICPTRYGKKVSGKPGSQEKYTYEIEVRPSLWLLTRNLDSRVFTRRGTVVDIVTEVLKSAGIAHEWKLLKGNRKRAYRDREFCVQYRETDYDFMRRLLAEEGIWFSFDRVEDRVVFYDGLQEVTASWPQKEMEYNEDKSFMIGRSHLERITDFRYTRSIGVGDFEIQDYNYETADVDLSFPQVGKKAPLYKKHHIYEHTAEFRKEPFGRQKSEELLHAENARTKVAKGKGLCRSLEAGDRTTMTHHFHEAFNVAWFVTQLEVKAQQGDYHVTFEALPISEPYRPPRLTGLRPHISGVQTATVTGPQNRKVYHDELGRCKIHFHWDRLNPKSEQASMWVRVSEGYAGPKYGTQFIPRVGHEVLVSFVDGNPDHPVVTGRVYNSQNKPPLGPGKRFQNIIKTIKDNHLLFDDSDGNELLELRAQCNMNTLVLNDSTETVGARKVVTVKEKDYVETVEKGSKFQTIHGDHQRIVKEGNDVIQVQKGYMLREVKYSETRIVSDGGRDTGIGGNDTLHVSGGYSLVVGAPKPKAGSIGSSSGGNPDHTVSVAKGKADLTAGKGRTVVVEKGNYRAAVKKGSIAFKAPSGSMVGNAKQISLEAEKSIMLKVGKNFIAIMPDKIILNGLNIASTSLGKHEIAGALVTIN